VSDIAVVTGASGGIGRAVAKMIHEKSEGQLRLCLHYSGNQKSAEALKAEIPNSFIVKADLSTAAGRSALLEAVLKEGTPYALVNNAGIDKPHEPALMISEQAYDQIMNVNLRAPAFLMKEFGKEMSRNESGVIVNVSSILASKALVGSALYRAAKAGLEALTKQFAYELGASGVRINCVAPGFIETPMTEGIADNVKDKILSQTALNRFGSPEAVAETVWHLIESDYINGAVVAIDGGMNL
jgi:3-oxoacyl-[acyl-carrier protein] reductase